MIYTTYFAQLRNLPKNIVPISICAKVPEWYRGRRCSYLAPTYDDLMEYRNTHDEEEYTRRYNEHVLSRLDANNVVQDLKRFEEKDIALICYEKSSDFCHRHLVAKWLNENGYECKEWYKSEVGDIDVREETVCVRNEQRNAGTFVF